MIIPKGKNSTTVRLNINEKIASVIDPKPEKIPDGRVPTFGRTTYE